MKDATSESPRSVTGRSPRIKFTRIVGKEEAEWSRAEELATMKEYAMYQRIMSSRPSHTASLPLPLTYWNKANTTSYPPQQDHQPQVPPPSPEEEVATSSDFADLDGIFEMDL